MRIRKFVQYIDTGLILSCHEHCWWHYSAQSGVISSTNHVMPLGVANQSAFRKLGPTVGWEDCAGSSSLLTRLVVVVGFRRVIRASIKYGPWYRSVNSVLTWWYVDSSCVSRLVSSWGSRTSRGSASGIIIFIMGSFWFSSLTRSAFMSEVITCFMCVLMVALY